MRFQKNFKNSQDFQNFSSFYCVWFKARNKTKISDSIKKFKPLCWRSNKKFEVNEKFYHEISHAVFLSLYSSFLLISTKKITKDIKNASNTYKFLSSHTHILIIIVVNSIYTLVLDLPPHLSILSFISFYAQLPAYLHTYTYKT